MIDLVICGPEMSGTGTQVADTIEWLRGRGKTVRDMRGTEVEALFHAKRFRALNENYVNLRDFVHDDKVLHTDKLYFFQDATRLLSFGETNRDLKVASMVLNEVSTFVDPDSADAWIFEEPTKRGAGQVNRATEQNRSRYSSTMDPIAAAYCHQTYRVDEYLRFRRVLREAGKFIVRSRSEESACYQIRDEYHLPHGIDRNAYLALPGHKLAFGNPPTCIFVVCGPADWTAEGYNELRAKRTAGRYLDDYEQNTDYILLVNRRYASAWLEELYEEACALYGSKPPVIHRFDINLPKDALREAMQRKLAENVDV